MNRLQYAKIFGLLAALATAAVTMIGGDYVTGIGIVAAAFSSSTAFNPKDGV